jgi:hypothetical protein
MELNWRHKFFLLNAVFDRQELFHGFAFRQTGLDRDPANLCRAC